MNQSLTISLVAVVGWFAEVDLQDSPPAARRMFTDVCELLDRLRPAKLAVDRQSATVQNGELWIRLIHADDDDANLNIVVGEGTTHIYGLYGHDEDYRLTGEPEATWRADTIETLTALLQGRYLIENLTWRGMAYRTLVTDRSGRARGVRAHDSALGLLPLPLRVLTASSRDLDYGCTDA
jgi:hypothetical protein